MTLQLRISNVINEPVLHGTNWNGTQRLHWAPGWLGNWTEKCLKAQFIANSCLVPGKELQAPWQGEEKELLATRAHNAQGSVAKMKIKSD